MRILAAAAIAALLLAPRPVSGRQAPVELESLMTTPVWLFDGARQVSQGTGFFYGNLKPDGTTDPNAVFFVTNYHVVTGHAPLLRTPRQGDRIRFALHTDLNNLEAIREYELPLYDAHNDPIWLSSQQYANADIVMVPMPQRALPLLVFTEQHTTANLKIRPTSGATLIGYPYGFFDRRHLLPIWKTGHLASEPDVDFEIGRAHV